MFFAIVTFSTQVSKKPSDFLIVLPTSFALQTTKTQSIKYFQF